MTDQERTEVMHKGRLAAKLILDNRGEVDLEFYKAAVRAFVLLDKEAILAEPSDAELEFLRKAKERYPNEKIAGQDYNIQDWVKLAPRTGAKECVRWLERWGSWWKIQSATGHRGDSWYLVSVAKQPRELPKANIDAMKILKDMDPQYAVVGYFKFPGEFKYELAEAQWRSNQVAS